MIDLKSHGITYDPAVDFDIVVGDLIALGNINRNVVDSYVVADNYEHITIRGKHLNVYGSAIIGGEIIHVEKSTVVGEDTVLDVIRGLHGTTQKDQSTYKFRTVKIIQSENNMELLDWTFEDTIGNVSNNLFPCELGSGSISISSKVYLWSPILDAQEFWVRPRKTVAYIFKGVGDKKILRHTAMVSKMDLLSKTHGSIQKVRLELKSRTFAWYDKDIATNITFKATKPLDFFKQLFSLSDFEVYYAEGVSDESFVSINNLNTKEYKKYSDILKAYCSNGVRFTFDRFERVKIFSDFIVRDIKSQKTIYEDVISPSLTSDEKMIYNSIDTKYIQRLPMYDYSDLGNRGVSYTRVLENCITSDKLITKENDKYIINMLEIKDLGVQLYSQIGSVVCFKSTSPPYTEVFAKVIDILGDGVVHIYPITTDKDILLFDNGKGEHLYKELYLKSSKMHLYYGRQELPMVSKFTRNYNNKEVDSKLMYPLLPRVDGAVIHKDETVYTFGCASNLKVGKYTGIVEEIQGIYGTWDKTKLLYNKEIEQFNGVNPPIFVLSNQVRERKVNETTYVLDYTTFDNSDLILQVTKPKDGDANIIMYNNKGINSGIDIKKDTEKNRLGNRILEVFDISKYTVGDVLKLIKPTDCTNMEEKEFEDVFVNMKWVVTNKIFEEDGKTYIGLSSNFPKRQTLGKTYEFEIYPSWSIVYVQELYIRGNPVIEFEQNVNALSLDVNFDGERSHVIYGEKKYNIEAKQLDKDGLKTLMGYILTNYQSVSKETTKFNIPISTYNGIDIEVLDVITILDPTYTQINADFLWLVTSVASKVGTNTVTLKLLNINKKDVKPYDIDIKEVLEYTPTEIPTYDHQGNEGDGGGANDGLGGEGNDSTLGTFQMALVDPQIFRATVEKVEGGYIYFKDFSGSEWQKYVDKLFPRAEFGISIQGETMLMQSDDKYRAYVRKRDIYDVGYMATISEGEVVNFLTMSYFVDIDGKLYSRSCKIGDGRSYFEYDIDTGASFVGDFKVGEDSQHAGNDLWEATLKSKTFSQTTPPTDTPYYTLMDGDMWYDSDDENHAYRYNGDVWLSCRDGSIISSRSSTYVQPNPPIPTIGRPINDGDTWYDSDDGNKPYVYKNETWVNVTDGNLSQAIAEAKKQSEKAIDSISDMANDNLITPSEKLQLKKDITELKAEYPKILDEAKKFGVDSSRYVNAYNLIVPYIETIIYIPGTTTPIDYEEFKSMFTRYYEERQHVFNLISSGVSNVTTMHNGKMLYLDPTFRNGTNDVKVYNNSSNGTVTVSRVLQTANTENYPTNDSGYTMKINKISGTASPNSGGFYFGTPTRKGMKIMTKIVAKIPVGYTINWHSNATGVGGKNYWVTEQKGTGDYREYVHVLECGQSGTFGSTSFFALSAEDGNNIKAVEWFLSYATCFDATSSNNDYVTQALGNSKIFHSPTAPTSGMKQNDLWYDTDDLNHPYVYNGTIWISARDKIFETEGGNLVYFQATQPPTTGTGVKNGDMWFNTSKTNALYILMDGKWVLADDAQDKIQNGKVILNSNTVVNGSFKVVGSSVELTAETTVKGTLSVYGGDKGIISYNGTNYANSTKRIIIQGGQIIFQER